MRLTVGSEEANRAFIAALKDFASARPARAMTRPMFDRVALIGLGLIGSSLSHVIRRQKLAAHIAGHARSADTRNQAVALGLVDSMHESAAAAARAADLVVLCVPVGRLCRGGIRDPAALEPGAIVTDVGSVKGTVIRDVGAHVPERRAFHSRPPDRRHRTVGTGRRLRGTVPGTLVHPDARQGRR